MCGRFTLTVDLAFLQERFQFQTAPDLGYEPRYNIAPTNEVLVVFQDPARQSAVMRWGLVPSWSKKSRPQVQPINAKAENVATSGMFKNALRRRRCLVLADGFYEWRKLTDGKPVRITLSTGEPFAFAGLWERWTPKAGEDGEAFSSCAIITTTPNDLIAPIHNRMPVILGHQEEGLWLDQDLPAEATASLLKPFPAEAMTMYEVSLRVNSVRNKGPELVLPVQQSSI